MLRLLACAVVVAGCNCQPPVIGRFDGGSGSGGGTAGAGGAGGGTPEPPDIDGGARECAAALTSGQSGGACTFSRRFWCGTTDFACGADARCHDGVVKKGGQATLLRSRGPRRRGAAVAQ